jgi:RimK family alpha-L-glutamate ligase
LRERGGLGRCVDLAACRFDTSSAWHGLVVPGFGRELPDAAVVRGIAGGSFEQVTHRLSVLHALRELGVPVYNDARAIERSVDKAMTSFLLHRAGVATPATWSGESTAHARRVAIREGAAGRSLVMKPLFGSQGRGLQRVGHVDGTHRPLPALEHGYGSVAYLQRFVQSSHSPGFDWRVLVVGGRAVTAMRRVSSHWIHNVAQGARCEPQPITTELADLACSAARALALDYAGVDIIACDEADAVGGIQVLEVNGVAAWHGLQRVTGFNIARALIDDLIDRRCGSVQGSAQTA